jgi:hypothetical protein
MIPIIASAVLSVAGQLAVKWISSAFTNSKAAPNPAPARAEAPKEDFAALLQRSQKTPEAGAPAAGAPVMLASAEPILPVGSSLPGAPVTPTTAGAGIRGGGQSAATTNPLFAADAYQRVQDFQSP